MRVVDRKSCNTFYCLEVLRLGKKFFFIHFFERKLFTEGLSSFSIKFSDFNGFEFQFVAVATREKTTGRRLDFEAKLKPCVTSNYTHINHLTMCENLSC
jgi:hypothetical protein